MPYSLYKGVYSFVLSINLNVFFLNAMIISKQWRRGAVGSASDL